MVHLSPLAVRSTCFSTFSTKNPHLSLSLKPFTNVLQIILPHTDVSLSIQRLFLFLHLFPVISAPLLPSHSLCTFRLPLPWSLFSTFSNPTFHSLSLTLSVSLSPPHTSVWRSAMCSVNIRLGRVFPPSFPEQLIQHVNKTTQKLQLKS